MSHSAEARQQSSPSKRRQAGKKRKKKRKRAHPSHTYLPFPNTSSSNSLPICTPPPFFFDWGLFRKLLMIFSSPPPPPPLFFYWGLFPKLLIVFSPPPPPPSVSCMDTCSLRSIFTPCVPSSRKLACSRRAKKSAPVQRQSFAKAVECGLLNLAKEEKFRASGLVEEEEETERNERKGAP